MIPSGSQAPPTDHNNLMVDLPKKARSSHIAMLEQIFWIYVSDGVQIIFVIYYTC